MRSLEHDPEKARPGLDPGWIPAFRKDHAPSNIQSAMMIQPEPIALKARRAQAAPTR
jgi:hypothetical protein